MAILNKTLKDLLSEISFEEHRLERIQNRYKRECGNLIIRTFNRNEKYVLKKQGFQEKIDNQEKLVANLERRLSEGTSLRYDLGMHFLAAIISLIEEEDYCFKHLTFHESDIFYPMTYSYNPFFSITTNKVGLIAKREVVEDLEEEQYGSSKVLYYGLKNSGEKSILKFALEELELFNGKEVPKDLVCDFPYIENACLDIVGLKLRNPELSEEEICLKYLETIKKRHTTEKKINYQKNNRKR